MRPILLLVFAFCTAVRASFGVILGDSGDPAKNTSTPGDNSGWQYEGDFGGFLGTPIAPQYFLTAKHVSPGVGAEFHFHGEKFTTTEAHLDSASDLAIIKVDHAFPSYAPLYFSGSETGMELRVFGKGAQRGSELILNGILKGWNWGGGNVLQRWGRNTVSGFANYQTLGDNLLLQAEFDSPGLPSEAHLSAGDSGGGVFVFEDGLWKLAAINYAVDDLYAAPDAGTRFIAAAFDARGYYTPDGLGGFVQIDWNENVPTSFYSTRITPRLAWIIGVTGINPAILPPESFAENWLPSYFTPEQLTAIPSVAGPADDMDADSIPTLLEFAFNLDPTFADHEFMTAATGVRGLPFIQLEAVAPGDERLTVEFVRRKAGSGSGVSYSVQFTSDLAAATWDTNGTESATPINGRWERVKVTDSVSSAVATRFARVAITQTPP